MFHSDGKYFNSAALSNLVENLDNERLQQLKAMFHEQSGGIQGHGLNKKTFLNVINALFGNSANSIQSNSLFDAITGKEEFSITWENFLIDNAPETHRSVFLNTTEIACAPHLNRETIVKIVPIETDQYFCYTIISKYGRVGLYDGNLNFLTSYQVIMTREDINRSDDERRRRNRWVTDALYCPDVLMLIITNSARSIMVYEASGLKHVPYWLIIGVPDIIESLAYKNCEKSNDSEEGGVSVLFCGDSNGNYKLFKFLQPCEGLLRRKHTDNITLFYWDALKHETNFVNIESWKNMHDSTVRQIDYSVIDRAILSCSRDPNASVIKTPFLHNGKPYIFKMEKGCDCFHWDDVHKLLVTGSENGIIRLWNSVIVTKPIAILSGHQASIVDVIMMSHEQYILSISRDGILKLWDIETNKCLQTLEINYPSFEIEGKDIEFGKNSIYPGPKRLFANNSESEGRNKILEYFGYADFNEKFECTSESIRNRSDMWKRSCLLATCCNHIATIETTFGNVVIQNSSELPLAPPPPLQNSVLIPSDWRVDERTVGPRIDHQEESFGEKLKELQFVLNKGLFEEQFTKYDINYRIAILESQKLQMQHHVERNSPYLALNIPEIEQLTLSPNLPIPEKKKLKDIAEKTKKILAEASMKNQIFSEPSSSRSKTSKSSIVEFSY